MWPKTISVKGITLRVDSWEEFDDLVKRYGGADEAQPDAGNTPRLTPLSPSAKLSIQSPVDRTLLRSFIDSGMHGLLNKELAEALGKEGKSIGPALKDWCLRIGLTEESGPVALRRVNTADGRGYKLTPHFRKVGEALLNG